MSRNNRLIVYILAYFLVSIMFGQPRGGKTYWATREILRVMKANSKLPVEKRRKIFTNYPVYSPEYGYTYQWKPEYAQQTVRDALVVIDEAYRNYNSRNATKGTFTVDEHTMFATNGHNDVDFILIVHNPARIDVVIREVCNNFYYVKPYRIPFMDRPIGFRCESYLDEIALSQRYTNPNALYGCERYFFRKKIAKAYDTHFFRKYDEPEPEFIDWSGKLGHLKKPKRTYGYFQRIKNKRNMDNGSCFNSFKMPKKHSYGILKFIAIQLIILMIYTVYYFR